QYNRLYGSIGAIIVLLVWLYLSALSLITGYEFNQSIVKAKAQADEKLSLLADEEDEED
ncbi:MAG: hypothetical protein HN921_04820, partial [Bacteroidetes bacterium]|nr:hypothetical protein [Bacteroidota bacterium]